MLALVPGCFVLWTEGWADCTRERPVRVGGVTVEGLANATALVGCADVEPALTGGLCDTSVEVPGRCGAEATFPVAVAEEAASLLAKMTREA